MKKIILLMSIALCSLAISAAEVVEIDGIYYNLIPKGNVAEVTSGTNPYTGNVTIPSSFKYEGVDYTVKKICDKTFYQCNNLKSVTIHEGIEEMGSSVFENCTNLQKAVVPNSVTTIGERMFYGCQNLKSFDIPSGITTIPSGMFGYCYGLTSLVIPDFITTIEGGAFGECINLKIINIGRGVTSIGSRAFMSCKALEAVHISDIAAWCNITFNGLDSSCEANPLMFANHLYLNEEEIKDLVIPNDVKEISYYAFYGCSGLTSVSIPSGVETIGGYAFYCCGHITSLVINDGVSKIGNYAFKYCAGLTSVNLPNSIISLGGEAFSNCYNLTEVRLGEFSEPYIDRFGIKQNSIASKAFATCKNLAHVYCRAETVPSAANDAFLESYSEYATLHVPENGIDSYKTTTPWSGFGSIITLTGQDAETKKCATPTITFATGKLSFECETEGVEFVCEITDADVKKHYSNEVLLTTTYQVSVYATKEGYENSDTATMEISLGGGGVPCDVNGDGKVDVSDYIGVANYILTGSIYGNGSMTRVTGSRRR